MILPDLINSASNVKVVLGGNYRPALHFICFTGEEYHSAVRIWGRPNFIHRLSDANAKREIAPGDLAIFARGTDEDLLAPLSFNDSAVM
jgi:hypothetical protein